MRKLIDAKQFNPLILAVLVLALSGVGYFLVRAIHGANGVGDGSTSLYLAPASASVASGTQFTVALRMSSAENIYLVRANLIYPASQLDFVSLSGAGSAFAIDAGSTGGSGSITMTRTNSGGVSVTGDQLVGTLTFKAKTVAGIANVSFSNGSFAYRSSDNTDVLASTSGGSYNVTTGTSPSTPPVSPTPPSPATQPPATPPTRSTPPTAPGTVPPTATTKPPASSSTTTSKPPVSSTSTVAPPVGGGSTSAVDGNIATSSTLSDGSGTGVALPISSVRGAVAKKTAPPLSAWLIGGLGLLAGLGGLAAILEVSRDRRKHRQAYAEQLSKSHPMRSTPISSSQVSPAVHTMVDPMTSNAPAGPIITTPQTIGTPLNAQPAPLSPAYQPNVAQVVPPQAPVPAPTPTPSPMLTPDPVVPVNTTAPVQPNVVAVKVNSPQLNEVTPPSQPIDPATGLEPKAWDI